jgi:hypothetical protein
MFTTVSGSQLKAPNPLEQEQLPVDSWGKQALALSFAGRTNGDTYRVLDKTATNGMTNVIHLKVNTGAASRY